MSLLIYLQILSFHHLANGITLPSQECVIESHRSGWSSLKKVAIMPIDNRYGMSEGASKVGLNPKEAKWLGQVTGVVACKDKNGKLVGGSGTLYDKNDQIVTSAHLFIRPDERRTDCYFQSRSTPPVKRKLVFNSNSVRYATENIPENTGLDLAVVKLDQPIRGVKPVKRLKDDQTIKSQDQVLMVSSQMLRMTRTVLPNEAVVQQCIVRDTAPPNGSEGTSLYTDCSATQTASGSMMYSRDGKGQLVGVAVLRGSGSEDQDYTPYSFAERNMARGLVFDGEIAKFVDKPMTAQTN